MEINKMLLNILGGGWQSPPGTAVLLSVSVGCRRCLGAHRTRVPGFRQQGGGRSTGNGLNGGVSFHSLHLDLQRLHCVAAIKISAQSAKADYNKVPNWLWKNHLQALILGSFSLTAH